MAVRGDLQRLPLTSSLDLCLIQRYATSSERYCLEDVPLVSEVNVIARDFYRHQGLMEVHSVTKFRRGKIERLHQLECLALQTSLHQSATQRSLQSCRIPVEDPGIACTQCLSQRTYYCLTLSHEQSPMVRRTFPDGGLAGLSLIRLWLVRVQPRCQAIIHVPSAAIPMPAIAR